MKMIINFQSFKLGRLILIGLVIYSALSLFAGRAAAQDPTPLPTPTPAPTWTPAAAPTDTPAPNVPNPPTPLPATVTPSNRLIDFRVDEDEIDSGDCVEFSWVVRGDIDRVEFDEIDDGKEAVLVSEQDEREECPDVDTEYKLIVKWLDGSKTSDSIEIDVLDDSSDGSSSSSGGNGTGQDSGSTVGVFIIVTPIAMSSLTPVAEENESDLFTQISPDGSDGQPVEKPAGILGSVNSLPETGHIPGQNSFSTANRPIVTNESLPDDRPEPLGQLISFGLWGVLIVVIVAAFKLLTHSGHISSPGGPRR